jgi:Cullin family
VENELVLRDSDASTRLAMTFHRSVTYHCDVLTAGAWPISSVTTEPSLILPSEVEAHVQLFSKFYTERSTGRKLVWAHHLSYGVLQANCFNKRYELSLSFYQMLILILVSR